jgi:hypothetical protein
MNCFEPEPGMVLKRKYFKEYTYLAMNGDEKQHILVLPVTSDSIVTINSQYVWEIKYGKQQGARFITRNKKLINLSKFMKLENKAICFKGKPYKILKHINESDIVDITDHDEIFGIQLFESMK